MVLTAEELDFLNGSVCGAISGGAEPHALSEANTTNIEGRNESFQTFDYLQSSGYNSEERAGFGFENVSEEFAGFDFGVVSEECAGFGFENVSQHIHRFKCDSLTFWLVQ